MLICGVFVSFLMILLNLIFRSWCVWSFGLLFFVGTSSGGCLRIKLREVHKRKKKEKKLNLCSITIFSLFFWFPKEEGSSLLKEWLGGGSSSLKSKTIKKNLRLRFSFSFLFWTSLSNQTDQFHMKLKETDILGLCNCNKF